MHPASELQARDGYASALTCTVYLPVRPPRLSAAFSAGAQKQEQERVSQEGGHTSAIEDSTPVREAGCSSALSQPRCSASHAVFRYLGAAASLGFSYSYPGALEGTCRWLFEKRGRKAQTARIAGEPLRQQSVGSWWVWHECRRGHGIRQIEG
jgi:hypothetical protein